MMIIRGKAIPRRTVLRGLGTTLALPVLDAMVPALAARNGGEGADASLHRLSAQRHHDGAVDSGRRGHGLRAETILQPLAPFRDKMTIISGLSHNAGGRAQQGENTGDHARAGASYLSGVHPKKTEGADTAAGVSIDQIAAKQIGTQNQLASLELCVDSPELLGQCEAGYSCAYMNSICWRTPTTPMPWKTASRRLRAPLRRFRKHDPAVRLSRIKQDRSILDSVTAKASRLKAELAGRSVEAHRISRRRSRCRAPHPDGRGAIGRKLPKVERPAGIPDTFTEHARMMFDLQVLALQTDLTRVITFMMGREFAAAPMRNRHPGRLHGLTHHQYNAEKIAKVIRSRPITPSTSAIIWTSCARLPMETERSWTTWWCCMAAASPTAIRTCTTICRSC